MESLYNRLPLKDPRTVAREIPGIFEIIFPQLSPGIVSYFNRNTIILGDIDAVSEDMIKSSKLQNAMLFEVCFARCEQMLSASPEAKWDDCLAVAIKRQRRHFDAQLPSELLPLDTKIAENVATNLVKMLEYLKSSSIDSALVASPQIQGYQWIASGNGDFSLGSKLIEVKCTNRHFGSADYRQVLMYWLLSYASVIERDVNEWKKIVFLNPRKNYVLELPFDEIITVTSAGKSKVEILELFSSMVDDIGLKTLPEFRL